MHTPTDVRNSLLYVEPSQQLFLSLHRRWFPSSLGSAWIILYLLSFLSETDTNCFIIIQPEGNVWKGWCFFSCRPLLITCLHLKILWKLKSINRRDFETRFKLYKLRTLLKDGWGFIRSWTWSSDLWSQLMRNLQTQIPRRVSWGRGNFYLQQETQLFWFCDDTILDEDEVLVPLFLFKESLLFVCFSPPDAVYYLDKGIRPDLSLQSSSACS